MKRALIAACILACTTCAAWSEAMRTWKTNGWDAGAYSNDRTGAFSHCAASANYKSGTTLLFSVNKSFGWSMGFANPAWNLRPGATYNIRYSVDSFPALTATATAVNKLLVTANLPGNTTLFELFRKVRQLTVHGEGQTFAFNLDYTSQVLAELLQCVRAFNASSTSVASNPWERPSAPAPAQSKSANSAAYRAEATAVVANVLSAAGIQGFSLAPEIPPKLSFLHAMWVAPGLVGGLEIADGETTTSASTMRIAIDAQSCKGTFASGKLPTTGEAARVMTACEEVGKTPERAEYTFLKRPKGGVYVFTLMAAEGSTVNIQESGAKLLDAALRSAR